MSVITISRQLGSLGTEVAQNVAHELSYQYVDKEKIGKALADFGLPQIAIDKLDEKKPPFWDAWVIERKRFSHYIRMVVYDFAQKNNVVIVGRGGQVFLRDLPGVLHVRIIAPFEVRMRRIMEQEAIDEKEAARVLRRNDRDSAGFIRAFFDEDWDDPGLYDLLLNTQKISAGTTSKLIVESNQSPEIKEGEKKTAGKLVDLILFQKVEAALIGILGMGVQSVGIHIEEGIVIFRGEVGSKNDKESCERAVANIEGVKGVRNQLLVKPRHQYGP